MCNYTNSFGRAIQYSWQSPGVPFPAALPHNTWHASKRAGDTEYKFQLGVLPHFETGDLTIPEVHRSVRVLGLGGKMYLDWGFDRRYPLLKHSEDDFVHFSGVLLDPYHRISCCLRRYRHGCRCVLHLGTQPCPEGGAGGGAPL